jgi:hypothetical protein
MPRVSGGPITSTPEVPGQPYDATADNNLGKWQAVDSNSGPADRSGHSTGKFESDANWSQT